MSQEFEEVEKRFPIDEPGASDARKEWVECKKKANDRIVEKLQSIEDWMETHKMNLRKEAEANKEKKREAMIASLTHMDSPQGTLETVRDFEETLASRTATWMDRLSEESFERVEMQLRAPEEGSENHSEKNTEPTQDGFSASRAKDYMALAESRDKDPTPEMQDVIMIARRIVDDMKDNRRLRPVADGDFVRVVLMRTYKQFQAEWAGRSNYRLLMDDARRVYHQAIEPRLDLRVKRSSYRKVEMTGSVTCPACKKGRWPTKLYDFPDLMTHIFENHTHETGDFQDFRVSHTEFPYHIDFPWCFIEWPRNLPILAAGQNTKGRWDLHGESEENPQLSHCGPGAFDGRIAASSIGPPSFEFVPNVLFAASQLAQSNLGDEFKTQIALEYAVMKYESVQHTRPGFDLLEELQLALMRNGIKGLFEAFRCKKCCEAVVHEGRVGYLARSVKPLGELSEHFQKAHLKGGDWTRDMLDLNTPQDLLAVLQLPYNNSSLSIFETLFPTQGDSTLDPQLRQLTAVMR
ncbi:MAG: hypothetical protein Q9213_000899 [Squamulea squamosa]